MYAGSEKPERRIATKPKTQSGGHEAYSTKRWRLTNLVPFEVYPCVPPTRYQHRRRLHQATQQRASYGGYLRTEASKPKGGVFGVSVGGGQPDVLIGKWRISFSRDFHHHPNPVDESSTPPPSRRSFVIDVGQLWLSFEREQYATRPFPYQHSFRTAGVEVRD